MHSASILCTNTIYATTTTKATSKQQPTNDQHRGPFWKNAVRYLKTFKISKSFENPLKRVVWVYLEVFKCVNMNANSQVEPTGRSICRFPINVINETLVISHPFIFPLLVGGRSHHATCGWLCERPLLSVSFLHHKQHGRQESSLVQGQVEREEEEEAQETKEEKTTLHCSSTRCYEQEPKSKHLPCVLYPLVPTRVRGGEEARPE